MAALATVANFITTARVLLQDGTVPYRYSDAELLVALGMAMLEARRLRTDLFIGRASTIPSYTTNDATAVVIDDQYRPALLYYIVGHAQLRDAEDTQDSRAMGFIGKFTSHMLANTA